MIDDMIRFLFFASAMRTEKKISFNKKISVFLIRDSVLIIRKKESVLIFEKIYFKSSKKNWKTFAYFPNYTVRFLSGQIISSCTKKMTNLKKKPGTGYPCVRLAIGSTFRSCRDEF